MSELATPKRMLNLTPHSVTIFGVDDDDQTTVPSFEGGAARMQTEPQKKCGTIGKSVTFSGAPVYTAQKFTGVQWPAGLDKEEFDAVLVSMPVGQHLAREAAAGRHPGFAVYGPNTGPDPERGAVREDGRIVGTRSLELYVAPQ